MEALRALATVKPLPAVTGAVGLIVLLAALSRLAGAELALSIFYIGPVVIATWAAGRAAGAGVAVCAAVVWTATEAQGHDYSRPWMPYLNGAIRTVALAGLSLGLDRLRRLLHFARTDHLTGLPNRRAFQDAAQSEIDRARRYQHPFTIAYLDVDGFKEVNDRQGHTSGDDLLRLLAKTLSGSVRRTDLAARLGGDEFAILLPETDVDAGKQAAKKVHEALQAVVADTRWHVTFSMGVVTFSRPPRDVEQALHVADTVMYNVKHAGRNRILYMTSTGEAA
jgi:diguanylate cyclase (GGDEF)-like protein